ncbi:MAG: ABC transporter permease [Tenericutes bacterium]|nr:ABC transporter permease [Mycoplasmatota bacterium]
MILSLIKRNLKLYFRDKISVFFSMLGVLIVLVLYLVFLANLFSSDIANIGYGLDPGEFIDNWIMAGVISVTTVTTTLGAYGVMINDNQTKIVNDFKVSPIKRSSLVLSYVLSSVLVGLIMSIFALCFAEAYILVYGGAIMRFSAIIKALGIILLSVLMSSSVIFFIIAFIKSSNAFAAISTVFGSIVGFLMGVYVPIGTLQGAASVIRAFPFAHTAVLMRQVMIQGTLPNGVNLDDLPDGVKQALGIEFAYGDFIMPASLHILLMLAVTILFFGLGVIAFSRKRK